VVIRSRRGLLVAVIVVVVAVGGYFGARALWQTAKTALASDTCTIGSYDIDPSQASVAATMVGAVTRYGVAHPHSGIGERAAVLVLAAGLQESKLRNLAPGDGDRDSVGVLQQRPSQGWGGAAAQRDPTVLNDVFFATTTFLDHRVKVPNWQAMSLADAVQAVQVSADGGAYAQHEPEAQALADALLGTTTAGISCSFDKPTKVAPAATVAQLLRHDLAVNPPTVTGRSLRVPQARWQTAAWLIAQADRLGIEQVSYDRKTWTRTDGWHADRAAGTTAVVATMYRAKA
jgi:hypothetical protein